MRRPLSFAAFILFSACFIQGPPAALAEEIWQVRSGLTTLRFNVLLMRDLGLDIAGVQGDVQTPPELDEFIEVPHWTFPIRTDSDLTFKVENGNPVPGGIVDGAIRHSGSFWIVELFASKAQTAIKSPEIAFESPDRYSPPDGPDPNPLYLRSAGSESPIVIEFAHSMFRLLPKDRVLKIHYLNMRISPQWAASLGRPDLANWVIGTGEVTADVEHMSGVSTSIPYEPQFDGGFLDVKLGILDSIQQAGHEGTHPNGTAGITMGTTSCNVGDVDVPWLAPMQEDHPVIHMALYRLLNGRFEQIGVSYMKHGFYALSNNQCTQCQHPSDGSFLGVGCSDTYGPGNNSDRRYLGPRKEINPFLGTWECLGSHFDGATHDCQREHGSGGHGPVDHMLVVKDTDLNNSGATYFYESYYIVRGDQARHNNWGSRRCTMSWNGNFWSFLTPTGNPLVEGPALERWGDLRTTVTVPEDGQVMLAVQTTDLGGGAYRYDYALLNLDSDRQIRSFSIPITGVPNVTGISFRDSDGIATNDWPVKVDGDAITWQTDTYAENPNAHALEFGLMFNFSFQASAAPATGQSQATLGLFKPAPAGAVDEVFANTTGPATTTTALSADGSPKAKVTLSAGRPNPLRPSTTVSFELPARQTVALEVFDVTGRLIRTLVEQAMPAGAHEIVWDGKGSHGERVGSAVYYLRLRAGSEVVVRPLLVVD